MEGKINYIIIHTGKGSDGTQRLESTIATIRTIRRGLQESRQ